MLLVDELKREFGSHLNAAMSGWEYAASYGDVLSVIHTTAFVNSNRDPKKTPEPYVLPTPWPRTAKETEVSESELLALRARLKKRSAFGDR